MTATIIATYSGGGTLWNPGVEVQEDDAIIWFLRLAQTDSEPASTVRASLADSDGTEIEFLRYGEKNWGTLAGYASGKHYIFSQEGNTAYDELGEEWVTLDQVYIMFHQFTSFEAGTHRIKFSIPSTSRARVEAAHLLRGVQPLTPGTFIYYDNLVEWSVIYHGASKEYDGFPATVPLGDGSTIIYCLWEMTLGIGAPAGYNSVPGTTLLSYTYDDPTEPPAIIDSVIAYFDELTGVSKSVSAPDENGAASPTSYTGYKMSAIVINGGDAVTPAGPTVYFADMIVFNAAAGAAVEF